MCGFCKIETANQATIASTAALASQSHGRRNRTTRGAVMARWSR
jgi:hypothetical protein